MKFMKLVLASAVKVVDKNCLLRLMRFGFVVSKNVHEKSKDYLAYYEMFNKIQQFISYKVQ